MKKDNRGLTLVELIVAIAITAIVAGSIAFLLRTSLHLYGNETADAALQQELQITLNQIMDYAMESQEVVVSGAGSDTDILALGKIIPKQSDSDKVKLDAQIIWREDDKLYLKKEIIDDIEKETKDGTLNAKVSSIVAVASATKDNYLLAEYVSAFSVNVAGPVDGTTNYKNPVALDISIEFKKKGSAEDIIKKVSDKAVLRNKLKLPIFINGTKYTLLEETGKLETVTENVDLEQAMAGDIHYVTPGSSTVKTKLTVIEVIPKTSCSLLGYLVAGKEPIDEYGIDACANKLVGHLQGDQPQFPDGSGSMNSNANLLTNNMSGTNTLPNYYVGSGTYSGYFEKVASRNSTVRRGRGGVYAISKDEGKKITGFNNIFFISEYTTYNTSLYSKDDFCWVWKEDSNISGEGFSRTGNSDDRTEEFNRYDLDSAPVGAKIYLIGCQKNKVVNNEMFLFYCMGYDQSNGRYGLCQGMNGQPEYFPENALAIRNLNKDNIEFLAYTPEELRNHDDDLKRADIIFFLAGSSGIYNRAADLISVEEPGKIDATPFAYKSDITFDEMKYIYNKVVNYKLGIVVSRPTYNNVKGKTQFKNLNNLFYMLYGMDNVNIVADGDHVYGLDNNRYYLNDPQKVKDLIAQKGSSAYLWSGRVMFTDFFKSNVADKTSYSYEYQVKDKVFSSSNSKYYVSNYHGKNDYITTDEFIHYREATCPSDESGTIGDIVVGNVFWYGSESWYSNVFTQWQNKVFGDSNNFNQATDRTGKRILDFLIKDYYGKKGFRPVANEQSIGVFANQAMIEDDGFIVKYDPYVASGNLGWVGNVITSTNGVMANSTADADSIGTIELVGYSVGNPSFNDHSPEGGGRFYLPENHENMTYEECLNAGMTYQHSFENLANNKGKALYLTYEELERAKTEGLYIYMLVRSSEQLYPSFLNANPNNPYVYYDVNQDFNPGVHLEPPRPSEIYCSEAWNAANGGVVNWGEAIRYKGGSNPKEKFVAEFRAQVPGYYFAGYFYPPTNYGNNRMIARIGIDEGEHIPNLVYTKTTLIAGSEIFYIAIRDDFDLD